MQQFRTRQPKRSGSESSFLLDLNGARLSFPSFLATKLADEFNSSNIKMK